MFDLGCTLLQARSSLTVPGLALPPPAAIAAAMGSGRDLKNCLLQAEFLDDTLQEGSPEGTAVQFLVNKELVSWRKRCQACSKLQF